MSPAISVNKGRCKHQALSSCSHPDCSPRGDSGWRKTGYWPWTAVVNIKGVISMSSDSWIFLYKEKHQNYSLEMSVFVISSNRSKFNYFFFPQKKLLYIQFLPDFFGVDPQSNLRGCLQVHRIKRNS